jgi:hypothetical protein
MSKEGSQATAPIVGQSSSRSQAKLDPALAAFLSGLIASGRGARVLVCGEARDVAPYTALTLPNVEWTVAGFKDGEGALLLNSEHSVAADDGTFDVAIAVNLSRRGITELPALLSELWRVSTSMVLHIDAPGSARQLEASWATVQLLPLQRWPGLAGVELLSASHARSSSLDVGQAVVHLERKLREERARVALAHAELARLELEIRDTREHTAVVENSVSFRVAKQFMDLPGARTAARAVKFAERARLELEHRGLSWPRTNDEVDPPGLPKVNRLAFDGLATRGQPNDPETFLKQAPRVVVLCHPEWRGIRAATYGQAPHVLEVPGVLSQTHARRLAIFLKDAGAERVVMNGFPPGTERLAEALAHIAPSIEFFVTFHGTPAQGFAEHPVIARLLELTDRKLIKKLGFVKHGLADYFRQRGYPAEYVMNICRMPSLPPAPVPATGQLQVGVFAPNVVHKNVETQLIAALMVPGTRVHTLEPVRAEYLERDRHRFVEHGLMPHPKFVKLLSTMQATCYVSLVECYPMTVLESIFCGAVCLTSMTSRIFEDDEELLKLLVVEEHDSPAAIARKLGVALEGRAEIIPRAQAYLNRLNERAERRWYEFLEE